MALAYFVIVKYDCKALWAHVTKKQTNKQKQKTVNKCKLLYIQIESSFYQMNFKLNTLILATENVHVQTRGKSGESINFTLNVFRPTPVFASAPA